MMFGAESGWTLVGAMTQWVNWTSINNPGGRNYLVTIDYFVPDTVFNIADAGTYQIPSGTQTVILPKATLSNVTGPQIAGASNGIKNYLTGAPCIPAGAYIDRSYINGAVSNQISGGVYGLNGDYTTNVPMTGCNGQQARIYNNRWVLRSAPSGGAVPGGGLYYSTSPSAGLKAMPNVGFGANLFGAIDRAQAWNAP